MLCTWPAVVHYTAVIWFEAIARALTTVWRHSVSFTTEGQCSSPSAPAPQHSWNQCLCCPLPASSCCRWGSPEHAAPLPCLQEGTTYNSYLIFGDKTALVDASHEKFRGLYLKALKEQLAARGRSLDYIVVSHTEPDHSGEHHMHGILQP